MSVSNILKILARVAIYIVSYLVLLIICISASIRIISEITFMIEPCGGFGCFGHGIFAVIFGLIFGFCTGSIIFVLLVDYRNRQRQDKQKRKRK